MCNSICFSSYYFFPPLASHDPLCLYGIYGISAIPQKPDAANPTFDLCSACSETGVRLRSMQVLYFYFTFFFLLCLPFLFALLVRRPELDLNPCKYVLHNKFTVFVSYGKLSRALTFENLCQNTKSGTSYAFFQCVYC